MKKCHFLDSLTYVVYVEKVGGTYKKCSGTSEGIQKDSKIQGNVEISTILPYTINKPKKNILHRNLQQYEKCAMLKNKSEKGCSGCYPKNYKILPQ